MDEITRDSLRPLLDLQKIDSGIDRLTARKAHLPEQQELDEAAGKRDEIATTHLEKQTELDGVVREQNKLEADIQLIDDKVQREQTRLYSGEIGNPKELSAIQAELDALRRRKTHLEDMELEVMERREILEKEFGELDAALRDAQGVVGAATDKRDAATVQIDAELEELRRKRDLLVPTLHPDLIGVYEDVRTKKGGVAVGALENGTCKACGLPLSPSERNRLKNSGKAIERCENCSRILIFV